MAKHTKRLVAAAVPASRYSTFTHEPADALMEALRREHVSYELLPHRHTETAVAEAEALDVDPHQVAKTLILETPFGDRAAPCFAPSIGSTCTRPAAHSPHPTWSSRTRSSSSAPTRSSSSVRCHPLVEAYDRVARRRARVRQPLRGLRGRHPQRVGAASNGELLSVAEAEVADLAEDDRTGGTMTTKISRRRVRGSGTTPAPRSCS